MRSKQSVIYTFLAVLGIIVLVNILSDSFFMRLDWTEDNRYTLSNATKDILKSLDEVVTVTAYFSEDLPPNIAQTRRDFKDLLVEYGSRSKDMVVYEFKDPNKDEEIEQEAMKNGIQPVIIDSREKDAVVQKKAYLGAIIQMGERSEVMPFIQPGAAMEYDLSSAIKKLSVTEKLQIGLLQGHGEPPLAAMQQARSSLSVMYNVQPVSLSDTTRALNRFNTVAIIAPTDSFPESHLQQLDEYLAGGNNLFIAINRVEGDLQNATGSTQTTGLEGWLQQKGIIVEDNMVVDSKSASVQVRQPNFPFPVSINFPYIPVASNFADHPATTGLESVVFQFVSSMSFEGDTAVKFTPLVFSSEKSGTRQVPLYFDVQRQWSENDFPLSKLTLGAAFEGPIEGNPDARMMVIADGNFPVNGTGQEAQQLQPDNVSLLVNSIDWLADETGLIELRTKGVTSRPLDEIDDSKKAFWKWFNFLLPLFLVVVYGIVRSQQKRNLRIKRMEEGYV